MTTNISALGTQVTVVAVPTFPQGFTITEFPGDNDPVSIEDVEVSNVEMGVNGDMVAWNKANPIPVELNVIPNSEADKNLQIIMSTNRAAKNKVSVADDITMVITYADGTRKTLTGGVIMQGAVANSITSDSRIKTKTYSFNFANII